MSKRLRGADVDVLPDVMIMAALHFLGHIDHINAKQVCRRWRVATNRAQKTSTVLCMDPRGHDNLSFAVMVEALTHMMSPPRVRTWVVNTGISQTSVRRVLARFDRFETIRWHLDGNGSPSDDLVGPLSLAIKSCSRLRVLELTNNSQPTTDVTLALYRHLLHNGRCMWLTELWFEEGLMLSGDRILAPLAAWGRVPYLTRLRLPKIRIADPDLLPLLRQCLAMQTLWLDLMDSDRVPTTDDYLVPVLAALAHAPLATLTLRLLDFACAFSENAAKGLVPLLGTLRSVTVVCSNVASTQWSDAAMRVVAEHLMPHLARFRHFPPLTMTEEFMHQTMDIGVEIDMNAAGPAPTDLTVLSQWLRCHPLSRHVVLPSGAVTVSHPARTAWKTLAEMWTERVLEFHSPIALSVLFGSLMRWGLPQALVNRSLTLRGDCLTIDDAAFDWHTTDCPRLPLKTLLLAGRIDTKLSGRFFLAMVHALACSNVMFFLGGFAQEQGHTIRRAQLKVIRQQCINGAADADALARNVSSPSQPWSFGIKVSNQRLQYGHVWSFAGVNVWVLAQPTKQRQPGCPVF